MEESSPPSHPTILKPPSFPPSDTFLSSLFSGCLSTTVTSWRVIPLAECRTVAEYESHVLTASFKQFNEWIHTNNINESNPLSVLPPYKSNAVALYADYKYLHRIFDSVLTVRNEDSDSRTDSDSILVCDGSSILLNPPGSNESIEVIDWNRLGAPGAPAYTTTFWAGSKGCHTPLHFDSYGRNVIVQLEGSKTWYLWSPSENTENIFRPRRVPYEESSIYADPSNFDPLNPEHLARHPPDMRVTLQAGDVLLLPKHWWHFVQTESDISLSMNVWLPVQDDSVDRVGEAITRFAFGALGDALRCTGIPVTCSQGWLSPSEEEDEQKEGGPLDHARNVEYLLDAVGEQRANFNENSGSLSDVDLMRKVVSELLHPESIRRCLKTVLSNKL